MCKLSKKGQKRSKLFGVARLLPVAASCLRLSYASSLNVRQLGSVDGVAPGAHLVELSLVKKEAHEVPLLNSLSFLWVH